MSQTDGTSGSHFRIAARRLVVPARMSEAARDALAHEIFQVHGRIFSGVSFDRFREHVIDPPAESTAIQLYLGTDGDIVGYCALHRYRREVQGRDAIVLRAEAGLRPEYRGRGATYTFGILRAIVETVKHPFTPKYYLGTLVHPSSYHLFCQYFPRLFPHPVNPASAEMEDVARQLSDSFPDPPVSAADPFVRDVGWVTIETPQERALNGRADRSDVRFFKKRNPGYVKGHGLVVVVPLTPVNLSAALFLRIRERALIVFGLRRADL